MEIFKYIRDILLRNKKLFIKLLLFFSILFTALIVFYISKENPENRNTPIQQENAPMVWEKKFPKIAPLPRTTHATIYIGNNEVLVFGGEVKRSPRANNFWCGNDTWIYNITLNQWVKVNTTISPPARVHTPMAYDEDNKVALLFGGWCNEVNNNYMLNDTWLFNVTTKKWIKKTPKTSPPKQSEDGLVYIGKNTFLLRTSYGDTWIYNTLTNKWSLINEGLPTRGSVAMAFNPDENIVLSFGGENSLIDKYYNDTWEYNISANKWIKINTHVSPEERTRAAIAYDSKNKVFVLFGGVTSQFGKRFNDTWIYNATNKNWMNVNALNTPSVRGGYYGMAYDPTLNLFVLFGGRHDPKVFLNETWTLKIT